MFVLATMAAASGSAPIKIRNMSQGGALLEGGALPPVGEHLSLRRGELVVSGHVVWRQQGKAGLSFDCAVEVMDWLPSGSGGQQRVDRTFQELKAGSIAAAVFALAIVFVFLILAAQFESWSMPFMVLLAVPLGLFGALLATYLRGLTNDVYFQIGMVTLIGLAAKNAILIVEFAVLKRKEGMSAAEAALEAARLRFRPIVMTSLAFILGVVPLAISSGAGSASRHAIGTGVIGGMLAATFIATFFIPMFYRLIAWKQPKPAEDDDDDAVDHHTHAQAAE